MLVTFASQTEQFKAMSNNELAEKHKFFIKSKQYFAACQVKAILEARNAEDQ